MHLIKKYNIVNLIIKILYYILLNLCKIVIFEYILTEKIDLLPKILLILDWFINEHISYI